MRTLTVAEVLSALSNEDPEANVYVEDSQFKLRPVNCIGTAPAVEGDPNWTPD